MQVLDQAMLHGAVTGPRQHIAQTAVSPKVRALAATIADAPPPGRGRGALLIGGGVVLSALVVVGVLVARALGGLGGPAAPQGHPVVPASVTMPMQPATTPPVPGTVRLQLSSIPSGAEVFFGDELLGKTPFESSQLRRETPLALVFKKGGYEDLFHRVAAGSDADVAVALVPKPTSVQHPDGKHVTDVRRPPKSGELGRRPGVPNQPPTAKDPPSEKRRTQGDLRNPFD